MTTLVQVNRAKNNRDESDIPMDDNYWKVVNSYRIEQNTAANPNPAGEVPASDAPLSAADQLASIGIT